MYRRPKFLEILLEIRQEMALEADYDVDLFAERVRAGNGPVAEIVDKPSTNGDERSSKTNGRPSRKAEVNIGSE
ncbi:MAG: hypothetical protein IPI64_04605 [Chloracidobacterium sp.]|nr:hypothetical protein [Chloracidobacterium sp.]